MVQIVSAPQETGQPLERTVTPHPFHLQSAAPDTRKKENETSASEEQRLFLLFGNKTKGTGLVLLELPVEDL